MTSRRTAATALVAASALGIACSEEGPELMASAPEGLRILAYNIHHGEGTDDQIDLPRLASVILEQDPDLVALQEVDRGAARTGGVDQAAVLGELTGLTPLYGPFMDFDGGSYGMALLTRWEVVRSRNIELPGACLDCPCNPFPCPEGRTSMMAVVRSPRDGKTVTFAGVHLYGSEAERLAQASALTTELATEPTPAILAGDFNAQPGTPVMTLLDPTWHILEKEGPPATFPAPAPTREIDYILLRKDSDVEVTRHIVLEEAAASDHRPILSDLLLTRPANAR